jgi:hypothetical protein
LIPGQFAHAALQFVQWDQDALGDMNLIPLFLRSHVQENRPLLVFLIGLSYRDFCREGSGAPEQQKDCRGERGHTQGDPQPAQILLASFALLTMGGT